MGIKSNENHGKRYGWKEQSEWSEERGISGKSNQDGMKKEVWVGGAIRMERGKR